LKKSREWEEVELQGRQVADFGGVLLEFEMLQKAMVVGVVE